MKIQPVNQNQQNYRKQNFYIPSFKATIPDIDSYSIFDAAVNSTYPNENVASTIRLDFYKTLCQKQKEILDIRDSKGQSPIVEIISDKTEQSTKFYVKLTLPTKKKSVKIPFIFNFIQTRENKGNPIGKQIVDRLIALIKQGTEELR